MSNVVASKRGNGLFPSMGRLSYLMGLYAENHQRLARMFDAESLPRGAWVSSIGDGMDLHLDVLERHAYTVDLRLTYGMTDPATGVRDPSAFVRVYRDARQAEATHCYIGQRWQDVLGLRPDPRVLVSHRLRMNTFLGKWLEFLADQGHSRFTLRFLDSPSPDASDAEWLPSALLGT